MHNGMNPTKIVTPSHAAAKPLFCVGEVLASNLSWTDYFC